MLFFRGTSNSGNTTPVGDRENSKLADNEDVRTRLMAKPESALNTGTQTGMVDRHTSYGKACSGANIDYRKHDCDVSVLVWLLLHDYVVGGQG